MRIVNISPPSSSKFNRRIHFMKMSSSRFYFEDRDTYQFFGKNCGETKKQNGELEHYVGLLCSKLPQTVVRLEKMGLATKPVFYKIGKFKGCAIFCFSNTSLIGRFLPRQSFSAKWRSTKVLPTSIFPLWVENSAVPLKHYFGNQ